MEGGGGSWLELDELAIIAGVALCVGRLSLFASKDERFVRRACHASRASSPCLAQSPMPELVGCADSARTPCTHAGAARRGCRRGALDMSNGRVRRVGRRATAGQVVRQPVQVPRSARCARRPQLDRRRPIGCTRGVPAVRETARRRGMIDRAMIAVRESSWGRGAMPGARPDQGRFMFGGVAGTSSMDEFGASLAWRRRSVGHPCPSEQPRGRQPDSELERPCRALPASPSSRSRRLSARRDTWSCATIASRSPAQA